MPPQHADLRLMRPWLAPVFWSSAKSAQVCWHGVRESMNVLPATLAQEGQQMFSLPITLQSCFMSAAVQ